MKKILISFIFIFTIFNHSYSDEYSGTSYNWSTGEYNNVDVSFNGSSMEVYNWDTGEYQDHDIESNEVVAHLKLIIGQQVNIILWT